jgi:hypothetical protein
MVVLGTQPEPVPAGCPNQIVSTSAEIRLLDSSSKVIKIKLVKDDTASSNFT